MLDKLNARDSDTVSNTHSEEEINAFIKIQSQQSQLIIQFLFFFYKKKQILFLELLKFLLLGFSLVQSLYSFIMFYTSTHYRNLFFCLFTHTHTGDGERGGVRQNPSLLHVPLSYDEGHALQELSPTYIQIQGLGPLMDQAQYA